MTQPSATQPSNLRSARRADQPGRDGLRQRLRDLQRARHGDALVAGARASSSAMAPATSSSEMVS